MPVELNIDTFFVYSGSYICYSFCFSAQGHGTHWPLIPRIFITCRVCCCLIFLHCLFYHGDFFSRLKTVTSRGKGVTTRTRAHRHARTLPNPEALGPDIEEGAVNRRPLWSLFLLPWGSAGPATSPAPSSYRLLTTLKGCRTNSYLQERPMSQSAAQLSVRKLQDRSKRQFLIPLSLPPDGDYSRSYRREGPLAREVLNIALTVKTVAIPV